MASLRVGGRRAPIAAAIAAIVVVVSGDSSSNRPAAGFASNARPVPTKRVNGTGRGVDCLKLRRPPRPVLNSSRKTTPALVPTNACVHFYECVGCGTVLRPKPGDCCVFCSYGANRCPPPDN